MNPAMMAGAAPQQAQQQTQPTPPPTGVGNVQATPGQDSMGDPNKMLQALEAAVKQVIDKNGYVDLNKLVMLWPQISQQMGLNIPFQTVMQMIEQNPDLLDSIISQMGLAGISINGKQISAEELMSQSQSGGSAATGSPAMNGPGAM